MTYNKPFKYNKQQKFLQDYAENYDENTEKLIKEEEDKEE